MSRLLPAVGPTHGVPSGMDERHAARRFRRSFDPRDRRTPREGRSWEARARMADLCFVTTCMGRLAVLRQTLGPMLGQAGGPCVVVVDYSCRDGAGDWVEANHPGARLVRVPGRATFNASEARNIGARHADAPWIGFVDSDVVLDPDFAAAVASSLEPGASTAPGRTTRDSAGP